jgi:hypothetical protein
MRRCVECQKRLWFWNPGLDSTFGWIHISCLDSKIRRDYDCL